MASASSRIAGEKTSKLHLLSADCSEPWLPVFSHANAIGFGLFDEQTRLQYANRALAAMHRSSPDSLIGYTLREMLGPAAGPVETALHKVIRTGSPSVPSEWFGKPERRSNNGNWLYSYLPIRNGSKRVTKVGAFVIEVTRQRQLEEFLARYGGGPLRSQGIEARLLSDDLRAAIDGYHAALAMSMARLSRGIERDPATLERLVPTLDKRLAKMEMLVAAVATRFPAGARY